MSLGRRRWLSQPKQRANSPSLCLFVLFRLAEDWMILTLLRAIFFIQSEIRMPISSRNMLMNTPRNVLPTAWESFNPVKSTNKFNHQNGTGRAFITVWFHFFFLYLNIFSHTQFLFKGSEFITTNPIKSDSTFWSLAHAFPYFKQY